MKYLFLLTIGPVQSFISQARKTQDLYAGSQLLADLIHCGLGYTKGMNGELIYPIHTEDASDFSMDMLQNTNSYPNRIVASITIDNISNFANGLENLLRNRFEQKANSLFKHFINSENRPASMDEQIKNFLEIYWAAVPFEESSNYQDCFKELEKNSSIVKNFRQIRPFPKQEVGRKCSVDGKYNVKIYRKELSEINKKQQDIRKKKLFAQDNFIIQPDYKKIQLQHIQPGEGLSAITFFKRLYRNNNNSLEESFPSTAAIALLNLQDNPEFEEALKKYKQLFGKYCYDMQLLFEDNLTSNYFRKYWIHSRTYINETPIEADQEQLLPKAQKALQSLKAFIEKEQLLYTKYYALLRFDGDSMGKWLAKARTKEQHQVFSKCLTVFAKKAKTYLDTEHRGKAVYAGGGDFLGFVNLGSLFEVMEQLQILFQEIVGQKVKQLFPNEKGITFSVGLVVAHYKTPLTEVVKKSKQLEDQAKVYREKEKGNTGLCFMTSSMVLAETYFKNKDWNVLESLVRHLKNKDLSTKFIFSFAKELETLSGTYPIEQAMSLQAATQTELARLIKRATPKGKNVPPNLVQALQELLSEHYKKKSNQQHLLEHQNYIHFLKLAEKLASNL